MFSCLTCDVEVASTKNIEELKAIISLINRYDAICMFFIEISQKNFDLYKGISNLFEKHEVGLHIHWGSMESYAKGLEKISIETMQTELEISLELLNKLGFKPISFRGGGLCCTDASLRLLKEYGFKIDSSVAAKLDEKEGWFQGHGSVPYMGYYYPSKRSYNIPAVSLKDKVGILEVPVTRMIPSGRSWFPYTLTPDNPFYKFIVYEWMMKSHGKSKALITPIFHSWGEGKLRGNKFPKFLEKLDQLIRFLINRDIKFIKFESLL
ncbi:MAG: hypothetical protein OIN87_06950 [Candidatus Methanoperedens sp.]|nr:hypothetical protein [Candidatus Methanoperedens sp.]